MKNHKNDIWVGIEDKTNNPDFMERMNQEFVQLPIVETLSDEKQAKNLSTNRRDFLKYLGFSLGAATVAASCEQPVRRAIPYVVKPDKIVPGVATYYASSFVDGGDYCSVLVKTREGRPIKIEGNDLSQVTRGATSARAQASVLSLYDTSRLRGPAQITNGVVESSDSFGWQELDRAVAGALNAQSQIRVVTNTILSPTAKRALEEFRAKFPNTQVVSYDPVSSAAMLVANDICFDEKVVPNYKFEDAQLIVSFNADFLGTWISPVEYASAYAKNRRIKDTNRPQMSRHVQIESGMTLTGSNADNRILIKPSETGAAIATLYNAVAKASGAQTVTAPALNEAAANALNKVAADLAANKGKSLVIASSNNIGEQVLINRINDLLGNYGNTIDFAEASLQRQGDDRSIQSLITEMNNGAVSAVFVWGANPAFDLPNAEQFIAGLAKVGTKVYLGETLNDTGALCNYAAPTHHYLESWGDAEPKRGHYSLIQPTIAPLFNTRQGEESFLVWAGSANLDKNAAQPYLEYLRAGWQANMFPQQNDFASFQSFWDNTLHGGVFHIPQPAKEVSFAGDIASAASKVTKPAGSELELSFFEPVGIGAGQYANNPWLQEMPDPVMRTVWGNYLSVETTFDGVRSFNSLNGLKSENSETDIANVTVKGIQHPFPVVPQFGQAKNTVSIGLGYGRQVVGLAGREIGKNVFPWLSVDSDNMTQYYATDVQVSGKAGTEKEFACVQYHHTMGVTGKDSRTEETIMADEAAAISVTAGLFRQGMKGGLTNRSIIYHGYLNYLETLVEHIHEKRGEAEYLNTKTLYPYEEYKEEFYSQGQHWGMHVDLNACIGCGACTVACMAENNVPVVGKKEVHRHHEMTWLRIDRYYFGDVDNPNTVYQPMMCQHCDNAPCENVCPVAATNHSSEGLNQMAYNRCIGTRYCANNCPYKVRRFNWLDYTTADVFPANEPTLNGEEMVPYGADNLTRMVLNPDVTVRSRGVMEKCSFCVQRIQEGKLTAKREGRQLRDSDIKSACQTACPTGAITFGDTNNDESELATRMDSPLNYYVLEEINVRPSVLYSAKVINRDEALDA